jgi:hypothetical protein
LVFISRSCVPRVPCEVALASLVSDPLRTKKGTTLGCATRFFVLAFCSFEFLLIIWRYGKENPNASRFEVRSLSSALLESASRGLPAPRRQRQRFGRPLQQIARSKNDPSHSR